ncbi:MAG: 30S ribosomal protein S2 [Candidatus Korarchaeota archaeon]
MSTRKKFEKELLVPIAEYKKYKTHVAPIRRGFSDKIKRFVNKWGIGVVLFDIEKLDERIRIAAKMIARYDISNVLVVSSATYTERILANFTKLLPVKIVTGRFVPGTITNYEMKNHVHPDVLIVTDVFHDKQAIDEASRLRIPIIGMCGPEVNPSYVDLIIPFNNKNASSLSLVYWLLAREIKKERGESLDNFPTLQEFFEAQESQK